MSKKQNISTIIRVGILKGADNLYLLIYFLYVSISKSIMSKKNIKICNVACLEPRTSRKETEMTTSLF